MPSKKKARSQARKAKKEEARQQAAASNSDGSNVAPGSSQASVRSSCTHINNLLVNCTLEDFKEAVTLFMDFDTNYETYHRRVDADASSSDDIGGEIDCQMLQDMDLQTKHDIHPKYLLLDDANKEVFRQLLISKGTHTILCMQQTRMDWTEMRDVTVYLMPVAILVLLIENGPNSYYSQQNHLSTSPREMVKMFHRRSPCSCLKDLYYTLKDNTSIQTWCNGCETASYVKKIFECDCKNRIYCSRECAKKDWPNHKLVCKANKEYELTTKRHVLVA
jgi:hypothetical protein